MRPAVVALLAIGFIVGAVAGARFIDIIPVDAVRIATLRMTTPAAIAGLPSLSAPLLTVRSHLGKAPVGICLTSRSGTDIALVRLARRLADAFALRSETP